MTPAARRATDAAVAEAVAAERARMVASLIRLTGDWDLAEDCVQAAVERALVRWPRDGIPRSPAAWLTTVARHRALDVQRRRRTERAKLQERALTDAAGAGGEAEGAATDDRLALIFTCCHPALPLEGRVALTLKTVAGLSHGRDRPGVPGVGADHVTAAAADQAEDRPCRHPLPGAARRPAGGAHGRRARRRLPRRQRRLRAAGRPRGRRGAGPGPPAGRSPAGRRRGPGAAGPAGVPGVAGGHPLRHEGRSGADGGAGPQSLGPGRHRRGAARAAASGRYRLQAGIAARHAAAPSAAETGRRGGVVRLYDALVVAQPSPVVALNRAVAVGFRDGWEAGLAALSPLEAGLAGYHLLPAARADFLRRLGRHAEAQDAYLAAIDLAVPGGPDHRLLRRRLAEVQVAGAAGGA